MKQCSIPIKIAACAILALALLAAPRAAFAQQELILNGSFESGAQSNMYGLPGWNWIGPAGNHSDYGVAQSSASPDLAQSGNFYAFFHGAPTDGSQDCLGQSVNLTVGAQYTVSYYLATDGPTAGTDASMYVLIGTTFPLDVVNDLLLTSYVPDSSNALPYQQFVTTFTATAASEILAFHGVDPSSSILLDNVSVTLAAPKLNLSLSPSNSLIFTWSGTTASYLLQASDSLSSTNWTTLTNAPAITNAAYQVILPAPAASQFYRLTLP